MGESFFDIQRFAAIDITFDNAVFTGTSSRDSVYNTGDSVTVDGVGNDDTVNNDHGNNVSINGGTGNDKIYNSGSNVTIVGGKGNDSIQHDGDTVTITGGADNDSIKINGTNVLLKYTSGDGNDLIQGFNSAATLQLGDNDTYTSTKSGDDLILTVGTGKITLEGAASLSALNIIGEKTQQTLSSNKQTFNNSSAANVTLGANTKIADASTRTKAVKITGNKLANSIVGGAGNDKILGNAGRDSILGRNGNDKLSGDAGNDYLNGGKGNDIIWGGTGNDTLNGGSGNDTLIGGAGSDIFVYSSGNDVINDYAAGDKISLGAAISKAKVSGSNVILTTGNGKLTVKNAKQKILTLIDAAGNENQTVIGGATLNLTDSNKSNVTLSSAYANASASKRTKAVKITGNEWNNSIVGGTKNDTLQGGGGNDTLRGGNGNDKLSGEAGNDYLNGGKGKDLIQGGAGNDTLYGGKGNDTLQGGSGSNVFIYNDGDGKDIIVDYKAEDIIKIATGIVDSVYKSGNNVVFKVGNGSITVKDAKNQVVTYSEGGEEKNYLPDSPYFLNSNGTNVTLSSSYNSKTFDAAAQNDTKNVIKIDASLVDDDLVIEGNEKANVIYGSSGDNTIYGGKGNDTLYGGDGYNLFVYKNGDGNDLIVDWSYNDTISIASGTMFSDITVKGETAIIKVGKGKISLQGAVGGQLHYWYDEEAHHTLLGYGSDNVLEDDNFITGNDLGAIVEYKVSDYSVVQAGNVTALTKNNNALPVLNQSKKK